MALEKRLWEWLREETRTIGKTLHMCRVENGAGLGTPDVEACYNGSGFHIELKGCDRGSQGSIRELHIRPEQVVWLTKRRNAGGRAFLFIRVGSGLELARYLIPGEYASVLAAGPVTERLLRRMSLLPPNASALEVIAACASGSMVPPEMVG